MRHENWSYKGSVAGCLDWNGALSKFAFHKT